MQLELITGIIIAIMIFTYMFIKYIHKQFNYEFKKRLPKHPLDISLHDYTPRNMDDLKYK